jgi:HAD domain in Swiss Army Knife RNA repair proteins
MKPLQTSQKPLLFVDIDGVISLFGWTSSGRPAGSFHSIDGIPHFLSSTAAGHLQALADHFEPVWCSGWEEKANDYLPHLLGLPAPYPFLSFEAVGPGGAHWKLAAIARHAGDRPLAWVDDSLSQECWEWAQLRDSPTLLVATEPATGLTEHDVARLIDWAGALPNGTRA